MNGTFFDKFGDCKTAPPKMPRAGQNCSRPHYRFRFGDSWAFARAAEPAVRIAPDCSGIEFEADLDALAMQAGRPLSGLEADLIRLAVAVYIADRCAPRHPYGAGAPAYWRRRIHVVIPLSSVDAWTEMRTALEDTLEYLTEDDWTFGFLPSRLPSGAEMQRYFPKPGSPEISWTALFSGGLDSLAGALEWLAGANGTGLLVSGQTHNRIACGQRDQVSGLRMDFPHRLEHLGVHYGLPEKKRQGVAGFESTQRTRAFIHTAIGSVAALMAGNSRLFLFENGFGALNLPCDFSQSGSQNSRGTHPVFLRRMAALVSGLFSRPFTIENPFAFSTKGQMLSSPNVRDFQTLLQKSFSCDLFPNYRRSASQCGCCASCLIRRLSFHAAGLEDNPAGYSADIFHPGRPWHGTERLAFSKLSVQAEKLGQCLHSPRPWPQLCAQWPDLLRTEMELSSPKFPDLAASLLRLHVDEWRNFSSGVSAPFAMAA